MKTSKNSSSPTSNCRQPLEPVTRLEQVPIALYEILDFAMHSEDPLAPQIVKLTRSIIEVTQIEASGLADLANLPRVAEIPGIGK